MMEIEGNWKMSKVSGGFSNRCFSVFARKCSFLELKDLPVSEKLNKTLY
jgi:hypothetical protein